MEESLIEKYVIDQIAAKTKENEELKAKIRDLENENLELSKNSKKPGTFEKEELGFSYDIDASDYYINPGSIDNFKKALAKKDFKWLENNGYNIKCYDYNYVVSINGTEFKMTLYCPYTASDGPRVSGYHQGEYNTEDEAKVVLLSELAEDIKNYEARVKDEKERENKKVSENDKTNGEV
jgi:hypothetical protein